MIKKKNIVRIVAVLGVAALLFAGSLESKITYADDSLKISGMYGTTISYEEIRTTELRDSLPAIQRRNNGIGFFGLRKGYFTLAELGKARLLVHAQAGPYIVLETQDEVIIINYRDPQRTRSEYAKLAERTD